MNPFTVIKLALVAALCVAAWFAVSTFIGKTEELATLHGVLEQADAVAKANQLEHERVNNVLLRKIEDADSALVAYRNRLLSTQSAAKRITATISPGPVDGASTEPGLSDADIEFRVRCGADAIKVLEWQEWATLHRLPIEH